MIRRGGLLLETLVALAIFVAAGLAILSALRQGVADARAWRERTTALDLARSALAQVEAGLATPESLNGPVPEWRDEEATLGAAFDDRPPMPSGWRLEVSTRPGGVGGTTLVSVRAFREKATGWRQSGPPEAGAAGVTLQQLVRGVPVVGGVP